MNRQAGEAQLPTLWLDCSTTPQASSRWGILVSAILLVAFIKHIAVSVRLRVHCSIGVLGEKMALATAAATIAGTTTLSAYLDAKFHFSSDLGQLYTFYLAAKTLAKAEREDRLSGFYQFEHHALTSPSIQAIWSRAGTYTFAQAYDLSCKYGNWFLSLGICPGDFVALYLQNSPELIFAWIGLWSIGAAPAMINWNLGGEGLMHCLNISKAKLLVCDEQADLRDRIEGVQNEISANRIRLEFLDGTLKGAIAQGDGNRPRDELRRGFTRTSPMALIYTSGTTGHPKGLPFPMSSIVAAGGVAHKLYGQRHGPDGDRWYICMPLYHGTGAISNLTALITGGMVAIGKGFSVRNFWNDIRDSKSTIFVYVGETIRYLLAAPPSPLDKEHKVRLAWGNGLRPDVWKNFQDRFGVPEIGEFFSSTEGMLTFRTWSRGDYLTNTVGHHGALLRFLTRNTQVPVANDHSTGEIQRDPRSGLAKRVPYEEGGEILVKVPDESSFSGYLDDHEASQKRFVRDILSKGDLYFRSGDALRRTKDGRWSFLDRLGDTYRWKGENVSTTEVAEVLGRYPGILEANVYGVLVPHTDGRAGCATVAIAPEQKDRFDWEGLASFAKARLPSYAVPVFIRIVGQVRGTHNNKQQKGPLRAEGANPNLRGTKVPDGKNDEMFWLPWKSSRYIPLTAKEWERLEKRSERL